MKRYNKHPWLAALAALMFVLLPGTGFTLGFGQIKLYSYLNEPIDAEIELLGAEDVDAAHLLASLASSQEFKKISLARPYFVTQLRFTVVKETKRTFIHVTSHDPVKIPSLEFLVVLQWSEGRLIRGYTLLFDPAPLGTIHKRQPQPQNQPPAAVNAIEGSLPAEDRAALLSRRKTALNQALTKPALVANAIASANGKGAAEFTDVSARVAANHSMLDNFENLFEEGAESDKKAAASSVETSQAVSIESSTESPTPMLQAMAMPAEVAEAESAVPPALTAWITGVDKNKLLLGSGLALLLGVGLTVLALRRARDTLPVSVVAQLCDPGTSIEIFDNELVMKLDLARQYISIQDTESAEEILQDVISRGNNREIEIAQGLLEKIRAL